VPKLVFAVVFLLSGIINAQIPSPSAGGAATNSALGSVQLDPSQTSSVLSKVATTGSAGDLSGTLLNSTLPANVSVATLSSSVINGYMTVDGVIYTNLNAAWTAAAALCTGGATVSPTIILGPGLFKISSALVEPEIGFCGVNLIGAGELVTQIQPTATMNAVIFKASGVQSNSGVVLRDFSIEGTPFISGTGYVTYATYGIWLQNARSVRMSNLTISDCGTNSSGENFALGEDSLPSGHAFGGVLTNITSIYNDGIYTFPATASGPNPPKYGVEFKSTAADSFLTIASVKNALTASFVFQAGGSDIKTYGIHGFGFANSGTGPYRPQFVIQDFGSLNTHTSPVLDTFHEAGIDMEGSYNTVTSPIYEWAVAPDTLSYLFEVGINAKWNQIKGGNCQALTGMVSSAYKFDDSHNISIAPGGSVFEAPTGCLGLFAYEWEDTSTTGRDHNYTTWSSPNTAFFLFDYGSRNKSSSTGTHLAVTVADSSNNNLFKVDDWGGITAGNVSTGTTTLAANTNLANGTGTVLANATTASFTVTLPSCTNATTSSLPTTGGRNIVVQKTDSSANTVTVTGVGGALINGASTLVISAQYAAKTVQCDSTSLNWFAR